MPAQPRGLFGRRCGALQFLWDSRLLIVVSSYVLVNLFQVAQKVRLGPWTDDWQTFIALGQARSPYELDTSVQFVWSPLMVPVMTATVQVGYWPWVAIHIGALGLLRDWRLIGLTAVSYGFWFDVAQGNTLTFAFVAGVLALRGSRLAALSYLAMLVLMPRPLMLPLAIWLLWRHSAMRWPFVLMLSLHSGWVFAAGWAIPWTQAALAHPPSSWTIGPTALVGMWWLLAGLPLAAWLTWHGRVGWAGLAISPYILPQYLIWPLVELNTRRDERPGDGANEHRPRHRRWEQLHERIRS